MNEITDNWQEILSFMEVEMGLYHASIDTWIKPLKVYNIEGNCISFILPDNFKEMKEFLKRKYLEPLKAAIIEITKHDYTIEFLLADEIEDYVNEEIHNQGNNHPDVIQEKAENARLNSKYRFDTFVVGESNRLTYSACLAVAEAPGSLYILYFYMEVLVLVKPTLCTPLQDIL